MSKEKYERLSSEMFDIDLKLIELIRKNGYRDHHEELEVDYKKIYFTKEETEILRKAEEIIMNKMDVVESYE